ncbi:MAG: GAF domain-containing protein [Acidimicrobiia bacterium]|nr:GAF domain-containing protein [Acidimicrobiia bacterium]
MERRRLQLWGVALLVLLILAVALVAASAVEIDTGSVSPTTVRYSLVGLAVGFCAYVVEKEIHLHRLSRLLFDERVLNSALSNRIQQLQSLAEASRAVNSVLDLGEVLDVILARALDMLEGAEGSIMLLEGEELRVVATRGSDLALGARVRLGESIAGRVARTREPLVLSGEADSRRFPGHQPRHRPVHSAMVVPLVNRGSSWECSTSTPRPGGTSTSTTSICSRSSPSRSRPRSRTPGSSRPSASTWPTSSSSTA